MTNKIINFPETTDQAWKRIEEQHKYDIAKIDFEMKCANWFAAGFATGVTVILVVSFAVYYFIGGSYE